MTASAQRNDSFRLVAVIGSGLLGGLAGWQYRSLHWAVELAQLAAGNVSAPPDNLLALTQAELWSGVTQLCTVALRLGIPEAALSSVLSVTLGALSFQALTLWVLALSNRSALAFCAAPVIWVSGAADYGVTYPIALVSTPHTYGAIGLSFALAAVGFYACGWRRFGLVLLGLAPAIHISTGLPVLLLVAGTTAVVDPRRLTREWIFASAGLAVSAASWLAFAVERPALPSVDSAIIAEAIRAFAGFWDVHRQPIRIAAPGVIWNGLAALLAIVWLSTRRLGQREQWIFVFVAITSVVSLALASVSHLPIDRQPLWLVVAIPARFLNLMAASFAGLAIAASSMGAGPRLFRLLIAATSAASIAVLAGWTRPGPILLALGVFAISRALVGPAAIPATPPARQLLDRLGVSSGVLASVLMLLVFGGSTREVSMNAMRIAAAASEPGLDFSGLGRGVLLTYGDAWLIQLRTRAPVLIEGGTLDTLPYTPELTTRIRDVLRDAYDLDLLAPPPDARTHGSIPTSSTRSAWEAFDGRRWHRLHEQYGVTGVLAPSDWKLALPLTQNGPTLSLYLVR